MIFTRKDLQEYLKRDNLGFGSQIFYKRMIKRLGGNDSTSVGLSIFLCWLFISCIEAL
jgi:hypothetical protein